MNCKVSFFITMKLLSLARFKTHLILFLFIMWYVFRSYSTYLSGLQRTGKPRERTVKLKLKVTDEMKRVACGLKPRQIRPGAETLTD